MGEDEGGTIPMLYCLALYLHLLRELVVIIIVIDRKASAYTVRPSS
jgi:hypothetical protein